MKKSLTLGVALLPIFGCSNLNTKGIKVQHDHVLAPPKAPGDNFFLHVNQEWMDTNQLPKGDGENGIGVRIEAASRKKIIEILNNLKPAELEEGSAEAKILYLYNLFKMSPEEHQKCLKAIFDEIENAESYQALLEVLRKYKIPVCVSVGYRHNFENHSVKLTIKPDDDKFHGCWEKFQMKEHITKMLTPFFEKKDLAAQKAVSIYNWQIKLNEWEKGHKNLNDEEEEIPMFPVAEFEKKYKNIPLEHYINKLSPNETLDGVGGNPEFIAFLNDELERTENLQTIKNLTEWLCVELVGKHLGGDLRKEYYQLNEHLKHEEQDSEGDQKPKEKPYLKENLSKEEQAIIKVQSVMGSAVGKFFVDHCFNQEDEVIQNVIKNVQVLFESLKAAFKEMIEETAWMSEGAQKHAREKIDKMKIKIGHLDKWDNCEDLRIDNKQNPFTNILEYRWYKERIKDKKRCPVPNSIEEEILDPDIELIPQKVCIGYRGEKNYVFIPACVLLYPPFFELLYNPNADNAKLFGAIGCMIGHEMAHSLDCMGRYYREKEDGSYEESYCTDDRVEKLPWESIFSSQIEELKEKLLQGWEGLNLPSDFNFEKVVFFNFKEIEYIDEIKYLLNFFATMQSWNVGEKQKYEQFVNDVFSSMEEIRRMEWEGQVRPESWTAEDESEYRKRIGVLEKHFREKCKGNGRQKLQEIIADLVGVKIACKAFQKKNVEGDDAQNKEFFASYASVCAAHRSAAYDAQMAKTDTHPSPEQRVNCILSFIDEWYEAYGITGGELFLHIEDRCYLLGKDGRAK